MSLENINSKMPSPLPQLLKDKLRDVNYWREGNVVEAVFVRRAARQAFFDLGQFGTGIVYGTELMNARELLKKLEPGDKISAKILNLDGEGGYAELSLAEADQQRLWQQAKELQEAGEVIKVKITGANAGGLIANLVDLKAFIPTSQLSNEHYPKVDQGDRQKILEELKKLIGEELSVKIIDVNPRNKKLILSEREILSGNVKELLAQYQVGQEVDTMVSGIADFGVFVRFVDNPQIEGLIHVSELDYRLVNNPKEM
ncbi:MAG: S1 RNA-binding domain-containing protein, partial [Patescibacteria group bacterium]